MTDLLAQAIERAKSLPLSRQDEVGAMLLELVEQDGSALRLSKSQRQEVEKRLSAPQDFVPDAEMQAFFSKHAG